MFNSSLVLSDAVYALITTIMIQWFAILKIPMPIFMVYISTSEYLITVISDIWT